MGDHKGGKEMTDQEKLKQWIAESSRIVFFGGAGVSTEIGKLVHRRGVN